MAFQYELVRYEPALKSRVVELQTHLWSPSATLNAAYYNWKYERNPYPPKSLIYVAMDRDKVVAMRGFFGVEWEAGIPAQRFPALYADDMVIAPEYRNHGLIFKLMAFAFDDLAKRGYDYVFNLSAGSQTLLTSLAMGWRSAGGVRLMRWQSPRIALQGRFDATMWRLPSPARNLARSWLRAIGSANRSLGDLDAGHIHRALRFTPSVTFQASPRCADMAELVGRSGNSGRIRHVRDSDYFAWRFQNPLSRYRFLFWDESRLGGYLVLHEYTSGYADPGVVNIVDWEASTASAEEGLLRAALEVAKNKRVKIWSATLDQQKIESLFKHGFQIAGRSVAAQSLAEILVRAVPGEQSKRDWLLAGKPLLDLASWDLRMLYSMRG